MKCYLKCTFEPMRGNEQTKIKYQQIYLPKQEIAETEEDHLRCLYVGPTPWL